MARVRRNPSDRLLDLSQQLKKTAPELRKQFHKELREGAKPLLPAIRRSARTRFPSRGGLNAHMAKGSRYRSVVKTGAATAGVSIRANRTDPRTDTEGRIWHPIPRVGSHRVQSTNVKTRKVKTTYQGGEFLVDEKGRKLGTVQHFPQAVGYFSEPIEEGVPDVRAHLVRTLGQWADRRFSE